MAEDKNQAFLEFLYVLKTAFEDSTRVSLAFWLGLWRGEPARSRAVPADDPDPGPETFAFELGLQLKPVWAEIDAAIRAALIAAAVDAILCSVGAKKTK